MAENAKQSVLEKLEYDSGYADRLNTRKRENEVLHKNTLEYKASQHEKQQVAERALREADRKRNPFVAKVNEQSLAKATLYRQKQQARLAAANMQSLEFAALEDEEIDAHGYDGLDDMGGSGMGLMGEHDPRDDI